MQYSADSMMYARKNEDDRMNASRSTTRTRMSVYSLLFPPMNRVTGEKQCHHRPFEDSGGEGIRVLIRSSRGQKRIFLSTLVHLAIG